MHDSAGRHRRVRDLVHRLVKIRIELLALRIELLDAMLLEGSQQVALGELDAFDQRLDAGVDALAQVGPDRIERAAHVV